MEKKRNWAGRMFRLLLGTVLGVFLCGMCAMARTETVTMPATSDGYFYSNDWGTSDVDVYHKFTMKKSGILTLGGTWRKPEGQDGMFVWLCNSKKKAMEINKSGSYVKTVSTATGGINIASTAKYRLTKGTYYIKTKGKQDYSLSLSIRFATPTENVALKDTGGASKAKAKTIAAGKRIGGIIAVGEVKGAADWYKFKVKKSQVLNFELSESGSTGLTFTLYGPSFSEGYILAADMIDSHYTVRTSKKDQWGNAVGDMKVKAGVYYIKVTRSSNPIFSNRLKMRSADYYIMWE